MYFDGYRYLGLRPDEIRALSFADYNVMMAAAVAAEKDTWRHTLVVAQAVINTQEKKPQPLGSLWDRIFGKKRKAKASMSWDDFHKRMAAADRRLAARAERLKKRKQENG